MELVVFVLFSISVFGVIEIVKDKHVCQQIEIQQDESDSGPTGRKGGILGVGVKACENGTRELKE